MLMNPLSLSQIPQPQVPQVDLDAKDAKEETNFSVDDKEKIERLQNERCPLCFEVTLSMVCWSKCLHKICLSCGYRLIRCAKPHGDIIYEGLNLDTNLSYSHQNILCPLCRTDQTSSFSVLECKLVTAFV